MAQKPVYDVLIVGGGVVGSAAASLIGKLFNAALRTPGVICVLLL